MHLTGTHFNYYLVCHRKLWLFANGIQMEHTSDLVFEGKLIHESSYAQRANSFKEVEIGGIKIDYYDSHNKVIHEIKKSQKEHQSHIWQLKYYIYILEKAAINEVSGLLEYPKLRKTEKVILTNEDRITIEAMEKEITEIIHSDTCSLVINKPKCKKCSYYDFCYASETTDI